MSARLIEFGDGNVLAQALGERVGKALEAAINERGSAFIAVSGGSTPQRFFNILSGADLDWQKVNVTLVDERFVPPTSERSNQALVMRELLTGKAKAANFIPLYYEAGSAAQAAKIASQRLATFDKPFDVVILGMGNDGHTASFFPESDHLAIALAPKTPRGIIDMQAPGAAEPRLTFTLASLEDARLLILHIEGAAKKATLEKAQQSGDEAEMPIRAVLRRASSPLEIFWAP